jgi:hypothetical protein
MRAKTVAFAFLAIPVTALITLAYASREPPIPPLPHAFYGSVEINGNPAPIGTVVMARGEGVAPGVGVPGQAGNPFVTTVVGWYGDPDPFEPKLIVQEWIAEGATLTFYVNGSPTGQTASWHSGEVTELDLSLTTNGTCR